MEDFLFSRMKEVGGEAEGITGPCCCTLLLDSEKYSVGPYIGPGLRELEHRCRAEVKGNLKPQCYTVW
jgi:hypothetical protein